MIVHEFQKNALEKVIMELSEFNGMKLFAIRAYYLQDAIKQIWMPTKKGITVRRELLEEIKKGVDKAVELMKEQK